MPRATGPVLACALCGLAGWLGAGACTFVVDTDELQAGCAHDEKACPLPGATVMQCVSTTLPQYGCGADSCRECTLPRATARCSTSGECAIASCDLGWRNCDNITANGCEVNIASDTRNCGACNNICSGDNAIMACGGSVCRITLCLDDFDDCDKRASNGCEVDLLTDKSHCGGCFQPCEGTCENGYCEGA